MARALCGLRALFGNAMPGWVARAAWRRACRELRVLEALTRRLVLVMSADMAAVRHAPRPGRSRQAAPPSPSRSAGFVLFDPLPGDLRPAGPITAPLPDDVATPTHGLARRLAALEAVMAAPEQAARRMANWLARPAPARTTPICLTARYSSAPGPDLLMDALALFHRLAVERLNAPP